MMMSNDDSIDNNVVSLGILNGTHLSITRQRKPILSIETHVIQHQFTRHLHLSHPHSIRNIVPPPQSHDTTPVVDDEPFTVHSLDESITKCTAYLSSSEEETYLEISPDGKLTLHDGGVEVHNVGCFLVHDFLNNGYDQILLLPRNFQIEQTEEMLTTHLWKGASLLTTDNDIFMGDKVEITHTNNDDLITITLNTNQKNPMIIDSPKKTNVVTTLPNDDDDPQKSRDYLQPLEQHLLKRFRDEILHHRRKISLQKRQKESLSLSRRALSRRGRAAVVPPSSGDDTTVATPLLTQWKYKMASRKRGRCYDDGMVLDMEISLILEFDNGRNLFLSCRHVPTNDDATATTTSTPPTTTSRSGVLPRWTKNTKISMRVSCRLPHVMMSSTDGIVMALNAHWTMMGGGSNDGGVSSGEDGMRQGRREDVVLGLLRLSAEELLLWEEDEDVWRLVDFDRGGDDDGSVSPPGILVDDRHPLILELSGDCSGGYNGSSSGGDSWNDIAKRLGDWDEESQKLVIYSHTLEERDSYLQLVMKYLPESCRITIPRQNNAYLKALRDGMLEEINYLESGQKSVKDVIEIQCQVDEMASRVLEHWNGNESFDDNSKSR